MAERAAPGIGAAQNRFGRAKAGWRRRPGESEAPGQIDRAAAAQIAFGTPQHLEDGEPAESIGQSTPLALWFASYKDGPARKHRVTSNGANNKTAPELTQPGSSRRPIARALIRLASLGESVFTGFGSL